MRIFMKLAEQAGQRIVLDITVEGLTPRDSIADVKRMYKAHEGMPTRQQCLLFTGDTQLKDNDTLGILGIQDGDTLEVRLTARHVPQGTVAWFQQRLQNRT